MIRECFSGNCFLKLLDHFASTRNTLETMAQEDQTGTTLCFDQIDMNVHHIFVSLSTQLLRMVTSAMVQFRAYIFLKDIISFYEHNPL